MPTMRTGIPSRPKLIAASVAACFALPSIAVLANPTGPSVVAGSASFASAGNQLTVINSANAIIQWRGFSIGVNEITRFLQSSSASAVLNRVVGAGGAIPQSVIDGVLASNGRVFLLNPAGVVIGPTGRIDVGGFFASSLALSDDDFLHGRMNFAAVPGAGDVVNGGVIQTRSAGRVYLVAPNVENSGVIRAPGGQIVLAAGRSVELASADSPGMTVQVTADAGQALNLGRLIADSGSIGMFGALVRNAGVAEANAAVAGPGGQIRFVASQDLTLDAGSVTSANGTSGGDVLLQAQGGTNLVGGAVEATGSAGQGGTVQALGVRVGVIGNGVIDASGATGGGTVRVGGDEHGANPAMQNAQSTYIGPDGVIRADAGATGNGGRVIVWSDGDTGFYGSISARGGSQAGNGGFVETSGAQNLQAFGSVDVGALNGAGGTWLLDPDYIDIVAGSAGTIYGGGCSPNCFADPPTGSTPSQIGVATIDAALAYGGSVELQATQDITHQTDMVLANSGALTERAGNNINLQGYSVSTQGNLTLSANDSTVITPSGSGAITSTMPVASTQLSTNSGSLTLSGASISVAGISTSGGSVDATASAGNITTGAIDTRTADYPVSPGGYVYLSSTGAVTTGDISTGGGYLDVYASADVNLGSLSTGFDSYGGDIYVDTTGGNVATGSIVTSPLVPAQANAFGGYVALYASGGITTGAVTTGGSSNYYNGVDFEAGTGDVVTGPISTRSQYAYYGGTSVRLSTGSGRIVVNGNIDTRGADGPYDSCGDGCLYYDGSAAGSVELYRTDTSTDPAGGVAVQVNGAILTGGGNGAVAPNGSSGNGGTGGSVTIGDGGGNALRGAVNVTSTIDTHGGSGAAGPSGDPYGTAGSGGYAGDVQVAAGGAVTLAAIDAFGGAGGTGALGASSPIGGSGGAGGNLNVTGASSIITGAIDAHGGVGGAGGSYGGSSSPDGGAGGDGAAGSSGTAGVLLSATGAVSTGAINTAGGAGGAGTNAASPAGSGGAGGLGGPVTVYGGSVTINGIVSTIGGAGGAAGAGNATNPGGTGGTGGTGGNIWLDASSGTGIVTFVNGGYDASGGLLALGGVDGGAGAGTAGLAGDPGLVTILNQLVFVFTNTSSPQPSPDLLAALIDGIDRSTSLGGWLGGGGYEEDQDEDQGKKGVGICKP